MSTIVIVSVCVAIATVIGLRVYFEQKEEKELQKLKQQVEEDKKNAAIFVQEEAIAVQQPVQVEAQPVAPAHVEEVAVVAEPKPKKKKRYYYPKKKETTPNKSKKQTKK